MKIGQYKLANEWMREESATPEEALNTWNEMEAEFKANRAMSQEPRIMDLAEGGQLVAPSVDGSRPGYAVKRGSRPTSKPGGWKSRYKIKAFDKVADLFLNTYAKDDIDIIYKVGKEIGQQINLIAKEPELLKYVSKQSGLTENDIWDICEVVGFFNYTNRLASGTKMIPNNEYYARSRNEV